MGIVASDLTPVRETVLKEIYDGAEQETQFPRLQAALNKYPCFVFCLDTLDAEKAMNIAQQALDGSDITQADYDLIDSKVNKTE